MMTKTNCKNSGELGAFQIYVLSSNPNDLGNMLGSSPIFRKTNELITR
jgi:hypothetical protein